MIRELDPASRLGEILFGLVMALGFTGAVRLGLEDADNRALFAGILGCNLAWAIVDGVMHVLTELFDRGRKARLAREVREAATDADALRAIAAELDGPLFALGRPEERSRIHHTVLDIVRREGFEAPGVHRRDLLGGIAVSLVILGATLPVVLPYLVLKDAEVAVRVSNAIAVGLLFALGEWWGRVVGARPLRVGAGLTLLGIGLVLVTIALGG